MIATGPPTDEIAALFTAGSANVRQRVDIYEQDGVTLFAQDVAIQSGSISVDMGRTERRNLDIVFDDEAVVYGPGDFWYDKIIRPYKGTLMANGEEWLYPLGEFFPDTISRSRFPATVGATCRDKSKILSQSKFAQTTTFSAGALVTDVLTALAINGGVTDLQIESSDKELLSDSTFKYGDDRWTAIQDIAQAISYEAYFNAFGVLVARPWVDPVTAPLTKHFQTGGESNLIDFERVTHDTFMRNDIIVHGDSDENALVFGRAINDNDLTPTSINNVGRRMEVIASQFVADDGAALLLAQSVLGVSALEQYDVSLTSLVIPWLEAGDAVEAWLPDAVPTDPTRFLLSSFSVPLGIESMTAQVKRVTNLA